MTDGVTTCLVILDYEDLFAIDKIVITGKTQPAETIPSSDCNIPKIFQIFSNIIITYFQNISSANIFHFTFFLHSC